MMSNRLTKSERRQQARLLYRTSMCRRGDQCPFYNPIDGTAEGCVFAHSAGERRCYYYALGLRCPKGDRCKRLHSMEPSQLAILQQFPQRQILRSEGRRPDRISPPYVNDLPPLHQYLPDTLPIATSKKEAVRLAGFASHAGPALSHIRARFLIPNPFRKVQPDPSLILLPDAFQSMDVARDFLCRCLQVESVQELSDMRRYDIENYTIDENVNQHGISLHAIYSDGLQEKRPSVLRGDAIIAMNAQDGSLHKGYVFYVNLDHVMVQFDTKHFKAPSNIQPYHIEFKLCDIPLRRQFLALTKVKTMLCDDEVFATPKGADDLDNVDNEIIERCVGKHSPRPANAMQLECIQQLVAATPEKDRLGLLLLHGPPGTGKTTTIVGFLQCLLSKNAVSTAGKRVLVCAPSNQAADLICEKLVDRFPHEAGRQILRVCAPSYDVSKTDTRVQGCVAAQQAIPAMAENATIVISTIMNAGLLYGVGVSCDGFDHLVVDEAGQATETELLVALMFASRGRGTHITLAGDHKQLGPIIRSRVAEEHDFSRPALERLIEKMRLAAHSIQLVESYRAHPDILNLYNTITYSGTLQARGDSRCTHALDGCDLFPMPTRPMAFFHLDGPESRERDSPSWMNRGEADAVIDLVALLLRRGLTFTDIVVLSPYNKQKKHIENLLHHHFARNMHSTSSVWSCPTYKRRDMPIRVCSVEMFQGREAKVIIMSCVRSVKGDDEVNKDLIQGIGFLKQPKRLNVAISRAIAGLFIIGNAAVLHQDSNWKQLLEMFSSDDPTQSSVVEGFHPSGSGPITHKQLSTSDLEVMAAAHQQRIAASRSTNIESTANDIHPNEAADIEWRRAE